MYKYIYILKIVSLYISWYIVTLISLGSLGWLLTPGNPPALPPEYWDQMNISPSHNWELSPELSSLMLQVDLRTFDGTQILSGLTKWRRFLSQARWCMYNPNIQEQTGLGSEWRYRGCYPIARLSGLSCPDRQCPFLSHPPRQTLPREGL